MSSIAQAIARFEGGLTPGTIAYNNNNPGNLKYSYWETQYGASEGVNGFALFPSFGSGMDALNARVTELENSGDSIAQLIHTWAGSQYPGNSSQSESNYVNFVAQKTGLNATQPINQQTSSWLHHALSFLNMFGALPGNSPIDKAKHFAENDVSRMVTGIIGLICIAGAIYLFKPTQTVIKSAVDTAKTTAETVAVAG